MIDRLTAGFPGSGKGNPGSAREQGCVSLSRKDGDDGWGKGSGDWW
jgi:hypothetical protein